MAAIALRRARLALLAGLALAVCSPLPSLHAAASEPASAPRFHPSRVIVQPKPGKNLRTLHALQGNRVLAELRDPDIQVVQLAGPGKVAETMAAYLRSGQVEFAEPDYLLRRCVVPNDPGYLDGTLWALHNTGQKGGLAGADLGAAQAWGLLNSAGKVVVAIVDSGIRYTHEDLAANMWRNPGEIAGNGIDDDGNGFVDDVHGINAPDENGDPWDDNGHGTHVAGIIGAVGNNGKGTVGVAWNVQLMALRFMDQYGEGATSDAVRCIDYARRNGAHIINASWGGSGFSLALQAAVRRARDAGIIFVTAAGNEAQDLDRFASYPASYSLNNVVTVAATTRGDLLADYSNYGLLRVALAAPGSEIYSTWHRSDRSYAYESGTSMAAPYVAGVFALAKARFPQDTHVELIQRVTGAAEALPLLADKCASGGRLSLLKALGGTVQPEPAAPKPVRLSVVPDPSAGSVRFSLSGAAGARYAIEASRDLVNWLPLLTLQASADGTLTFADPSDLSAGHRYFRARLVPVQ